MPSDGKSSPLARWANKNKKYHTVETAPKCNGKIVDRGKIDTPNTHIHDSSLSCLGKGTSIKSGRVKLVLRVNNYKSSNN